MNPIFIKIGSVSIYWYSIFILLAILIGCSIILLESKKHKLSKEFMENLFFYTLIFGLIGARIYYVIFEYKQYINNPIDIFKVWEGGLAIHGGIIAGLIAIIIMTKKHKIPTLKITDMAVLGVIIGQAIGRWGNFFNGEAYGPQVALETLQNIHIPQFIIDGMHIGGVYYHPTFLYESLWNIIGFIILMILKNNKKIKIGQLTGFYFIWYSVGRFFIEGLRQDSLMLFGIIKQAQLISIVLIVLGIVLMIKSRKNQKYSEE